MILVFRGLENEIVGVAHKGASDTKSGTIKKFVNRKFGEPKAGEESYTQVGGTIYAHRSWMPAGRILTLEEFDDDQVVIA